MPMMALKEPKFRQEIQQVSLSPHGVHISGSQTMIQMMYIAGEPQDPSLETLSLIEVLVHEQVVQMVASSHNWR